MARVTNCAARATPRAAGGSGPSRWPIRVESRHSPGPSDPHVEIKQEGEDCENGADNYTSRQPAPRRENQKQVIRDFKNE
jgi:hypothetical protein